MLLFYSLWLQVLLTAVPFLLLFLSVFHRRIEIRNHRRQLEELRSRADNIELQALRSQMNPHFIFNTLNSIQHFITNNNSDEASKYLSRFAKLMRVIIENSKQTSIKIKDEVEATRLYLELETMRFSDKFFFGILVDPVIDINYDEIPSMIIQPYIENAIIHGLLPNTEKGKLLIHLTKKDTFIVCTIEDNGIGRLKSQELNKNRTAQHRSLGMSITKRRLSILNQQNKTKNNLNEEIIDVVNADGTAAGTRVIIQIPIDNS
jgi:LytS/YehU family sensor histidine kinase